MRWQKNPEPEWGPKPRARRCAGKESDEVKNVENTEGSSPGVKRTCEQVTGNIVLHGTCVLCS